MQQKFFITSTGTGIGKTFITAALVRQAKQLGRSVAAFKPVISGFDTDTISESDTAVLLRSLGLELTPENVEKISPWRFKAPLAPSMAARVENREVDFDAMLRSSKSMIQGGEDMILIEGVGGVMVPMDDRHTVLDWIAGLNIPVLLVVGSYLGSISHTLTAVSALQQKGINLHAAIVNESKESSVELQESFEELRRWVPYSLISMRRDGPDEDLIPILLP
jgi:dethiobiotin synthetase